MTRASSKARSWKAWAVIDLNGNYATEIYQRKDDARMDFNDSKHLIDAKFKLVRDHSAMRAENEARLTEMQRVVCAALDEHETEVRRSLSRLAGKLGGAIDAVRKESP